MVLGRAARPLCYFGPCSMPCEQSSPLLSGRGAQQVSLSHQVVSRRRKSEHPADSRDATVASLAQARHGFEPAENLFVPFALALTYRVNRMVVHASIALLGLHATCEVPRCSRSFPDELLAVEAFLADGIERSRLQSPGHYLSPRS